MMWNRYTPQRGKPLWGLFYVKEIVAYAGLQQPFARVDPVAEVFFDAVVKQRCDAENKAREHLEGAAVLKQDCLAESAHDADFHPRRIRLNV